MINSIKYYYGISVSDLVQKDNDYYFDNYILKYYYKDLDVDLYNYLIKQNNYLHKIIYNQENNYITYIDNKPYILLKVEIENNITLNFIKKYNIFFNYKKNPGWDMLWENKIDFYEKNITNIKDEKIYNSFNYFVGMTENAISIYKKLKLNNDFYLCHIRFSNDIDFYDPLNIIVDYKMRDIAEYIKKEFYLKNKYYLETINEIVAYNNYNDTMLFLVRMMYPTIYFDQYDNYIKKESINYLFYDKREKYEHYLKEIYQTIKKKYQIIRIEWLE